MNLILVTEPCERLLLPGSMLQVAASLTGVDWQREAAVVVDLGERPTGGYGVQVEAIRLTAPGWVEIDLSLRQPGRGMMVTQAFTHPHAVARIDRTWLSVRPLTLVARDQSSGAELARLVVNR